jgi:hypothetical protein
MFIYRIKSFSASNLKSVVKIEWTNYHTSFFDVLIQKLTSLNKFERKKSETNIIFFRPKICVQLLVTFFVA